MLPDELINRNQRCPTCGIEPIAAAVSCDRPPPRSILGMSVPVFASVAAVLLVCAGVCLVLLPMIQSVRETSGRVVTTKNNLRRIAHSIHIYAEVHDYLPTEAAIYGDNKGQLSWRVHLLQYLGWGTLYDQFHLDEPWDSQHNKQLITRMPWVYWSPTSNVDEEGKTVYLAVTGPGTAFEKGKKIRLDALDGMSNTIMLVEVSDERAVIWTKPDDWEFDPDRPMDGLMGQRDDGFLVLAVDGKVHLVKPDFDQETFKRLVLRNDGEPAEFDD